MKQLSALSKLAGAVLSPVSQAEDLGYGKHGVRPNFLIENRVFDVDANHKIFGLLLGAYKRFRAVLQKKFAR